MFRRPAVVAVLVLAALLAPASVAQGSSTTHVTVLDAPAGAQAIVVAATTDVRSSSILATRATGSGAHAVNGTATGTAGAPATATIKVDYHGFPDNAKAAFQAAVDIWQTMIVSSQVIHVKATWKSLSSGTLGDAGPSITFPGDGLAYPTALYESMCSCSVNGSLPDIVAEMNSSFGSWYLGTDGNPPLHKWDFESVVLHELGHGLGFLSSFRVNSNGVGRYGETDGTNWYPLGFDQHEWSAATGGSRMVSFASPSTALANQLTDGSVYFDGPNVQNVLGQRAKLYAPNPWQSGSSNSHLDENEYPQSSGNGLMTPMLFNGEVEHDPGPLMLAMFRDIGWATAPYAPPPPPTVPDAPQNVVATAGNALADVSWAAPASDGGSPITGYVVTSKPDSQTCQTSGATSCTVTGLTNDTSYTFSVVAFNDAGNSPPSAPSPPVTPSETADIAPTIAPPTFTITAGQTLHATAVVHLAWPDATDASGITSYDLQVKRGRHAWRMVTLDSPTATTADVGLKPGTRYRFRLRATDGAGNTSAWLTTDASKLRLRQEKAHAISYTGQWRRHALNGASGGHVRSTGASRRVATLTFRGTSAALVSTLGRNRGIVDIWLDGAYVTSVDLYAPSVTTRAIVWATDQPLAPGTHTIQLRPTGTHNDSATRSRVDLDAFLTWR